MSAMENDQTRLTELFSLSGKVALVTGSRAGLGRAIATGLAQAGAEVVLHGHHDDLGETAAEIARAGGKSRRWIADLLARPSTRSPASRRRCRASGPATVSRCLLTLADGQHAVADHISLLPAFDTHTAGSQFVLVEDEASGPWLFAGDNVYVYENIEGLRGEGAYAPISMATGSPSTWLAVTDDVLRSVGGATQRVLVRFHRPGRGSQRGDHDGRRRTW